MSSSPISPEEIRAAAEVHRELGPDYQSAVIESFLDKVDREIDHRVEARLASVQRASPPPAPVKNQANFIAVASIALGIPITAIVLTSGSHPAGLPGLLIVWAAIAAINIAYASRMRPPSGGR